jgi:Mg2+ and Co2+ transporter CorA
MDISELVNQMQPSLKEVSRMARQIEKAAQNFEDAIYRDHNKGDFDRIRVLDRDGDSDNSFHFGERDMDEDFGEDARFDR